MTKKITLVTSAFRSEQYLKCYFENILALNNLDCIKVIVVLNEPTDIERKLAESYKRLFPDNLKIVALDKRESIGASTNRGYRMAKTEYVTYADVDDYRPPDCYERLLKTLEDDSDADFTYGDFVTVRAQGETNGKLTETPEFDPKKFVRGSFVGPNHFFRRRLLDKCGYWDEQLRSGGDFDFQVRCAFNCKFKKTPGVICYYTKEENSGSASSNILQPIERTVVLLRYGMYDKIESLEGYQYVAPAKRYRLDQLLIGGEWQPIQQYVRGYRHMIVKQEPTRLAFRAKYRRKIARHYAALPFRTFDRCARSGIRWALRRLGLLEKTRTLILKVLSSFTNRSCDQVPLIIERMEVDLALSRLHEKRKLRVIDVGAHHGEFLDIFESCSEEHIFDVVCVEPMPENLTVLRRKIKNYKRLSVLVCDVAISEVGGTKTFYQGRSSTLFTCTPEWKEYFPEEFTDPKEVPIRCMTFADLLAQFKIDKKPSFDFIKIDTEGHDLNVLYSMVAAQIRPFSVMFEIGNDLGAVDKAVSLLSNYGFKEFYVFGRTGIPTTFIGEWQGLQRLQSLRKAGKLEAGNVVAF